MQGYVVTSAINWNGLDGGQYVSPGTIYLPKLGIKVRKFRTVDGDRTELKPIEYDELGNVRLFGKEGTPNQAFRETEVSDTLVQKVVQAKKAIDEGPKRLSSAIEDLCRSVPR